MKKRCFALIFAMVFTSGTLSAFAGESSTPATEYASVGEVIYWQDYESYTATGDLNTIDTTSGGKTLKLSYTSAGTQQEIYNMQPTVTEDAVEISFKILPRETSGKAARFYVQFLNGSNVSLQLQLDATAATSRYGLYVSNTELVSSTELNQISYDAETFTADDFNAFRLLLKRERDNENTPTGGTMELYLNGVAKHPAGGYNIDALGNGCKFKDNPITRIRMYYVSSSGYNPEQTMYVDDISVIAFRKVAYVPAALSMSFEAGMDYEGGTPRLIVENGTDSLYLQQSMELSLIRADDAADVTTLNRVDVTKAQDGTAAFSFAEDVSVSPGWYFVDVKRYINGEIKGTGKSRKLYIATAEQLADLPGDFSNLPENMAEAEAKVEYYLPCFLTEEEIEALLPSDSAELAAANLSFITRYFRNCGIAFATPAEVQSSFNKSRIYLGIKNAEDNAALRGILASGGYLDSYLDNQIFIENEEEFFAHFNTKRYDSENPILSDNAVDAALTYSMAMTSLNHAKRSGIKGIVQDYNSVFELDLDAASGLKEDDLYVALYNKGYTAVSDIQADWAAKIKELSASDAGENQNEEKEIVRTPSGGGSIKISPAAVEPPQIAPAETPQASFSDISGHWAEKFIALLHQKNIVTGYADGRFYPDQSLTRAEFVTMLARILPDNTVKEGIPFTDISKTDWFYQAVTELSAAGIVQGRDQMFMPNDPITREELAAMVYRALGASGEAAESISFADAEDISEYAIEAVNALAARGVLSGFEDGTMRPQRLTSRAEAAKLLSVVLSSLSE